MAIALLVVGIICSVLPTIELYGVDMGKWMKSYNPYILLYMMGFYLMYVDENRLGKKSYAFMGAFCAVVLMCDPWITIMLFAIVIFALSLVLTYVLRLIPVLNKYVL